VATVGLLIMDERGAIQDQAQHLFEAWCDRRSASALLQILQGYPLTSDLTDDWDQLRKALEGVRAFAGFELTSEEHSAVEDLIARVTRLLTKR
jgi:hypothetical protein